MSAIAIDLCNQALALIGAEAISSFDDGTHLAATCATLYPAVRAQMLVTYPWRFCNTKAQLATLTEAPLFGWRHAFGMPPKFLRLNALFDSPADNARPFTGFQLFDGRVMASRQPLWMDYGYDAAEEAWPVHFRSLMRYALAAEFAVPVTENASVGEPWQAKAFGPPSEKSQGGMVGWARKIDALQNPARGLTQYPLIDARFGAR